MQEPSVLDPFTQRRSSHRASYSKSFRLNRPFKGNRCFMLLAWLRRHACMENSAKGGGQDPSKSRPQEDALSESPFGATGVFGQANRSTSPDGFETEAARDVVPLDPWREQAPKAPLPPRPASLAEPVVHKVALGSGGGGNSQDLLQRIRNIREDRAVPERGGSLRSQPPVRRRRKGNPPLPKAAAPASQRC